MAFGQNIEEIVLKVRAEGRGETGAMREEIRRLNEDVKKFFATVAEGGGDEGVGHWVRQINSAAREIKVLEDALKQVDPEYQRLIQTQRDVSQAFADSQREQAEAAKKMAADRTEAARKILAAEKLANQQAAAEMEAVHARLKEMDDRDAGGGAESQRRNAEAVVAGTKAVRDQMQAYDDMAAVRARLGQMEAADQATSQERLRESAALRMQEVESAVEGAKRKDAAIAESAQRQKEAIRSTGDELSRQMREQGANSFVAQRGHERVAESARKLAVEQGKGAQASDRFGYSVLNVAHAFQDLQYGVGALLNNIPLVVQAFGGGPGLAGVIMTTAVAAEALRPHLGEIAKEMGLVEDKAKKAAQNLDAMKEKVAAMTAKPMKVDFDYTQIREANAEVERMERRVAAAKGAATASTDIQEKVGKEVKGVVVEYAGASDEKTGYSNLVELIRQAEIDRGRFYQQDPDFAKLKDLEQARDRATARLNDPETGAAGRLQAQGTIALATAKLSELYDRIEGNQRARIGQEVVGGALAGEEKGVEKLIGYFERNRDLFTTGIPGRVRGVDPEFAEMLKSARPGEIKAREAEDLQQKLAEESRKMWDDIERAKRVPVEREVSSLVSKKAKPLEDELGPDILRRIQAGDRREDIAVEMNDEVMRRMGDVPNAREAAARIARQLIEAAFADVMAAKGPGIDDAAAAGNLLRGQAEAAAAKGAKGINDPVTGQPLSDHEKWRLKQMDEEIRNGQKEREHANTPGGMQQAFRNRSLMQMQGMGRDIAQARPDLSQQQVMGAAQKANQLVGQGWNRAAAMNEALLRLNQDLFQTMKMMQARQMGFTGSVGQLRQQNRRMQQQRPTLLPTFPGGF